MLRFEDPTWLSALWLLPIIPACAWFSAAVRARGWRLASAGLRVAIVAAVVVALARPVREQVSEQRLPAEVVALLDISDSVTAHRPQAGDARERWPQYRDALPDGVERTAVAFAAQVAPLEKPAHAQSGETDIAAAIDWAIEQLGPGTNGHILLLSDGRATRGEPLPAAARAAGAGLRLHAIPIGRRWDSAPRIVAVTPPDDARVGLTSHALVRIRADQPTDVLLTLVDGDGIEAARLATRVSGDSVVGLPLAPQRKGLHAWSVLLQTGGGNAAPLDAADLGFDVVGPPQVLVCDPQPLGLGALQQVLRQLQFEHRVAAPAEFPRSREALAAYDAVVLSDWPAPGLDEQQQHLLEQFVNQGGGFVFIGGARVGARKWHGSPLEQLLPIDFAPAPVREKQRLKPVHVCYVLDVSGSMEQVLGVDASGPVTKFAMTKAAVAASVDALPETAIVSVIVFNIRHQVVLEAVPIEQRDTIKEQVARLGVGGGTNVVPAMVAAVQILNRTDIARHMIVLTDGISSEDPPEELLEWISAARIALTSVAVGADSNTALMEHIARETQGVYHYCGDATRIPRVFVREAEHIKTLAAIDRPPIQPRRGPQPDLLRDIAPDGWPLLEAALPARPKPSPGVEVALIGADGHPLLARWPVGLGSVTAFMSDAKPAWARRWMQWPEFERFWAKILSSALPGSSALQTAMDVRIEADRCIALLSVFDEQGRLPQDVIPTGQLTTEGDPAQATIPLRWQRLPSGVFEGHAPVEPGARYIGSITVHADDGSAALRRRFLVAARGQTELLETGPARRTLRALAAAGNGRHAPTPEQLRAALGAEQITTTMIVTPYWRWLLMLALALWPFDVACRRLGT
jgi:uncharacterized membrane protein